MYSSLRLSLLISMLLTVANASLAATETNPLARDLRILAGWFEGEFDNEEQIWFESDPRSATPEEQRHTRIHVAHRRVELPSFGEHVFYVEEYKDNDPAEIIRQRLVIFSSDQDGKAIRMRQGFFRDAKRVRSAHKNADLLNRVKMEDVTFLDECDVYWKRVADQFQGGMKPKACVFGEGEKRRYSVHNLILSANKYWRVDTTFLVSDDSLHVGSPIDQPYEMRRAKQFICGVSFRAEDGTEQAIEGLRLHSQGGTVDVRRDSDGAEFTILMRDKEYPYYETRPEFIYFSIRNKGEAKSIVFTVNDPLSRRVGVNIGGMLAHCYRDGYHFQESYEQLQ